MRKANRRGPRFTATIAAGALALAGTTTLALAGAASAAQAAPAATTYRFETLDNAHDVTFNQLLGINNKGLIVGYFGSGAQNHPNKGYRLNAPYGQHNYVNENFPHSVQTQVRCPEASGQSIH